MPGWIPLGLIAWALVVGLGALAERVEASDYDTIDPARVAIETDARFVDPRWERTLTARLARLEPFEASDVTGLERVGAALAELPFVAEVEAPRLVWPDGVSVRLRFERPVACLRRAGAFLCVSTSGRVLPGGWGAPPELDGVPLPVLGRLGRDEPDAVPGSRLPRAGLWHGLALARSMERHLTREERAALGVVTIDAENGAVAEVANPGAVLHLEGRRAVLFGRTPDVDAPGALPVATKWRHVAEADALFRTGELAWRAIDVRWDRYAVAPRVDQEPPRPAEWKSAVERRREERREERRTAATTAASRTERGASPSTSPAAVNRTSSAPLGRVR